MVDNKESINVKVKKWTKAEVTGNNKCPVCNEDMIIIPTMCTVMGYCIRCKVHYLDMEQLQGFDNSIKKIDKCISKMGV